VGLIMVGGTPSKRNGTSRPQDDVEEKSQGPFRAMAGGIKKSQRSEERAVGHLKAANTSRCGAVPDRNPSYGQRPAPSPSSSGRPDGGAGQAPVVAAQSQFGPLRRTILFSRLIRSLRPLDRIISGNHSLYTGRNGRPALRRTIDLAVPSMQRLQKNGHSPLRRGFLKEGCFEEAENRCLPQASAHQV
jgi:hypothetical protein